MLIIITTQPGAADTAMGELQKINAGARMKKVLSAEARLVEFPGAEITELRNLIFVRHLFPVNWSGGIYSNDLPDILPLSAGESGDGPFSVQLRVAPREDALFARAKEILQNAEDILIGRGFEKDDKNPTWTLSFFVSGDKTLYAGVSRCVDNLSAWNGGAARFARDEKFISRAEFKLLEAMAIYPRHDGVCESSLGRVSIHAPNALYNRSASMLCHDAANKPAANFSPRGGAVKMSALDLGAAPGGWTRALLDMGFYVTAVDPAEMHESLAGRTGFTHVRATVQHCDFKEASFDLIANDMRMDMYESARIMTGAAKYLKPGAQAIMTLKLSQGHWLQKTEKALAMLSEAYTIRGARQLFHNRDEVTVVMAKTSGKS